MNYDPQKDFKPKEDLFEPYSKPTSEYLRLPVDVQVQFIDKESKVDSLRVLIG
jgi:hypothetical protein